ncbi:hypothetical protein LTR12_007204 [Friedmanniomyces endolithicus]|nr:hypothetical protein LTR74_013978 [Friedmanniomyces endolithicus]KAK1818407.1 hypothetical protein LTR12_007204 [Friedmanniomyces endolithicus]
MSKRERSATPELVERKHARFTMEMPIRTRPAPIARLGDEIRGGGDTGGESPRRTEVVEQRYSKRLRKKREQEELEYGDEEWEGFGDWEPGDLPAGEPGDDGEGGMTEVEGGESSDAEDDEVQKAQEAGENGEGISEGDDAAEDDEEYAPSDINVELTNYPILRSTIDHTGAIAKYWGPGSLDQLLDQKLIPKEVIPLSEPSGGELRDIPVERWSSRVHCKLAILALSARLADANHYLLKVYEERQAESERGRLGLEEGDVKHASMEVEMARHKGLVWHPRDNPRK